MSYNIKVSKFSKLKPPLNNLNHHWIAAHYHPLQIPKSAKWCTVVSFAFLIKQTLQHTAHLLNSVFLYFPTAPFIFFYLALSRSFLSSSLSQFKEEIMRQTVCRVAQISREEPLHLGGNLSAPHVLTPGASASERRDEPTRHSTKWNMRHQQVRHINISHP